MTDITANVIVSMPSQLFTMARSFKAVANGKIYIGKIDTDPVNPENQIQVYVENEEGSHVPVSQPIIINAAGYPVYNGQIAKFVTVQGHSMAIYDAYGVQQFYYPNVLKYDPDQFSKRIGKISFIHFKTVSDIFSGLTIDGFPANLTANDYVVTNGGTIWMVKTSNPSSISDIEPMTPYNVIDFGADKTGVTDSTSAFIASGGSNIPSGVYRIEKHLTGTYFSDGDVDIVGSGTVKIIPIGHSRMQESLPVDTTKSTGGPIYTKGASSIYPNENEFYRLPSIVKSNFDARTYLVYAVLVGSSDDIGQSATQTSRIELRTSNNNLSFSSPTIISTDGEQQASEPAICFDEKRGRLWVFYTTARGVVGVGHGATGYDPNTTMQNWVTYSDTYGDTWSTPENITTIIKPENATSAWFSPSPVCVTGDGDLLIPYSWYTVDKFMQGYIHVKINADATVKYQRQLILEGGSGDSWGSGELQIMQLGDGSLLSMIRDGYTDADGKKGLQLIYRSFDGVNWIEQAALETSPCKSGMCIFSSMSNGDSRNTILVTAPTGNDDSNRYRNNLKLWASTDNGVTWEKFPDTMFDDPTFSTSYSTISPLPGGAFMVVAEGSQYKSLNIKHRAIGAFTQQSNFAKSWGVIPVTQTAAETRLCQYYDIPQYSLYFNSDKRTLNANIGGTALRLTESQNEMDVTTAVTTLDSNSSTTFYLSVTTTLKSITGTASRVIVVSTKSASPITLSEDASVALANRIRVNKTLSGKAVVLYRTKYGWYPDTGAA